MSMGYFNAPLSLIDRSCGKNKLTNQKFKYKNSEVK